MFNFWRYFIPIPWRPLWYQSTQAHPLWTLFMPSYSYGPYVSPPQGGQIFTTYGYSGESSESENPPQPSGSNSNHGSPSEGPMGTSPYGQDKGPNEQTQKTPGQSQTITHDPITMTTESHRTTYHTTVNTMNSVQHGNSMDPKPNTKPFTVQPNEDHSNSKPMKGSKPQEEGHSNSHPMTTPRPGTVGTTLTTVKPQSTNGKPNPDTKNETKCDKKKDEKDHKLEDLAKNFTQSVKKGESKVQNTLKELKQNVSESFKNSEKKVQNGIGEMKQTISESMKSNENKVKNGISEMKQNVSQLIKNSEKKLQNASQTLSEEKNLTNIWLSSEVNKLKEKWNNTMSSVGPKGNGQVGITPDVYQDWVEKTTSISFEQDHGNENNPSNTGNSHRDKNVNKNNPNNPEGSHSDEISIHGNQQSFSNKTKRYSKEFTQLFVLPNQFNFTKDGMNFLVPLWWNISEYEPEFGAGLFITKMRQEVQRNGKIEKELS